MVRGHHVGCLLGSEKAYCRNFRAWGAMWAPFRRKVIVVSIHLKIKMKIKRERRNNDIQFFLPVIMQSRKPRPATVSCVSLDTSSTCHLTRSPSPAIQGWTTDFGLLERNVDLHLQDSSYDKPAIQSILEEPTPTVHVPQGVWDDLFDKALQALNTVPFDEDLKIWSVPCGRQLICVKWCILCV